MTIREYTPADEQGWLRCRVLSFLDTSYFADVKTEKEKYLQPEMSLVAEENGRIIGLIDIELDSYDLVMAGDERGAVIWNLAVLPEYRKHGVAKALWEEAQARLIKQAIRYCEVWTQQDEPANAFYKAMKFIQEDSQTWLRCRANAAGVEKLIPAESMMGLYGIDELIFNVPLHRRDELLPLCDKMDEVRMYSIHF